MSYSPTIFRPQMFKNRIINGDFQIWQRGTSASYASDSSALTGTGGYKSADRIWCSNTKAGGQFTVSKGEINGVSSFRVTVDAPSDNLTWDGTNDRYWAPFVYNFEGQHLYDIAAKKSKMTISFLFKSNVSGIFSLALRNQSYVGQAGTWDHSQLDSYVTTFSYPGDETPKRIVKTISMDYDWVYGVFGDKKLGFALFIAALGDAYTTDVLNQWQSGTSGNAVGASYAPVVASGYTNWAATAGNYIEIAQLQLEEGDTATEFEHVPYDVQLLRCLRYYEKLDFAGGCSCSENTNYTWQGAYSCSFNAPKRAVPSITFLNTTQNSSSFDLDIVQTGFKINMTGCGSSALYYYWGSCVVDAEL